MGFQHGPHAEALAQLKEFLVLVRCIEQHGVACLVATDHEHIVVHGADHVPVDLNPTVSPMWCHHCLA